MISINATLVVQVGQFLILTFVLNRLLFKPILKLIHERNAHIEKTKNQISDLELKAERLRQQCSAIEDAVRKRGAAKRSQLKGEALSQAKERISDSRRQAAALRADADQAADDEIARARPSLPREALLLAEDIIEKVIDRRTKA